MHIDKEISQTLICGLLVANCLVSVMNKVGISWQECESMKDICTEINKTRLNCYPIEGTLIENLGSKISVLGVGYHNL